MINQLLVTFMFLFTSDNLIIEENCESFYNHQFTNVVYEGRIKELKQDETYLLVYIDTEEEDGLEVRLLKNNIGIQIFKNLKIGDQLLKRKKDFIGFAVLKFDLDGNMIQITTYDNLCES